MARYKRSHAGSGISLECETVRVAADGRYHLLRDDHIISSHRSLKSGTSAYLAMLGELGVSIKAPAPSAVSSVTETPAAPSPRLFGDFYVYGKQKRRKTGTRTYG